MMKQYEVLWLDDEHESLDIIKEQGLLAGINLHCFTNAEEGLKEIESSYDDYDAIILDGLFYETSEQSGDILSEKAFFDVALAIETLKSKKIIPWFILSGQISFTRETNKLADYFKGNRVYDKTIDSDIESLWSDIRIAADNQIETQIKHDFQDAFKAFDLEIIDDSYKHNLVEILTSLKKEDYKKKNLNVIRDILESIYSTLIEKYNCIPDSFLNRNKQPNLEWCTRYLEGRDTNDGNGIRHNIRNMNLEIPEEISVALRFIKVNSSAYSHLNEDEFIKNEFISSTYAVIKVLEWLPGFIEENFN